MNLKENEPDFVNEEGTKWWKERYLTDWAQNPDMFNTTLPMVAYTIETKEGYRSFVLIDAEGIVDSSQSSEAIACKIDVLKFIKRESQYATMQRQDLKPNEQE